jgi:thiol-disulfide isomerase/thioredoxin
MLKGNFMVLVNMLLSFLLTVSSPEIPVELETMDSGKVVFSDEAKGLTVINFWAVWCKPCVQELPYLNNLYKKYKEEGVKFIAVSVSPDKKLISQFIDKTPIDFKILIDSDEKLSDKYLISVLPTTVLIDENQKVLLKIRGFSRRDLAKMEKIIQEKLQIKNNKE